MSQLSDSEIRDLCINCHYPMIQPFGDGQTEPGKISWGLGSYGYDIRVGSKFKVLDNFVAGYNQTIDVKSNEWHKAFTHYETNEHIIIPPNSFALAESIEIFDIPKDILVIVLGKSSLARCGIIVNVTPGEPEWKGKWTMEISNTTPLPAKIYANEGIAQAIFLRANKICERSYLDKKGKYQNQGGLTMPTVNKNIRGVKIYPGLFNLLPSKLQSIYKDLIIEEYTNLEIFNLLPIRNIDGILIGHTCNARIENGYVVADMEPINMEPIKEN